ncbi:hypothetical protein PLESTB_000223500 [Pleodorina starrii]|uniref:Uncharacterized protein n=1 Tax=Pleodorina starrii TaxID=330485 RepID=A0A9W6BC72_9CHLO|nr:hypothetical protein PLESTB_000223500 [Pleodorina starrii]GLC75718.1 hypothetical protein PLESTF_001677100 [Pleodorina starrii]
MSSKPASTKSEAQDVFLYRREVLKSPDEVLSEARKNHSIFKSNVVTGSFRPNVRNVGLSRFQFGDGEYAASVESMQRLITEKTARPEPLPEMHEPVRLTRTLSRSMSSRHNPFRSSVCTKPRLQVDDGGGVSTGPHDGELSPGQAQQQAQAQNQGKTDTGKAQVEADTAAAAAASAASEGAGPAEPAIASDANQQAIIGRNDSVTSPAAAGPVISRRPSVGAGSRRSTSFRSLAANKPQSPHAGALSSPSSGGGFVGPAFWSVDSVGERDGAGDGEADADADNGSGGDGSGDDGSGGGQPSTTSPANASAHASASTYPALANNTPASGADSDLDCGAGSPGGAFTSSFSLFAPRSSVASPVLSSNLSESSTCRVDQLLRDLRKFKVAATLATAAAGGGRSARVSLSGGPRFESARDQFISKGRSATLNHLPDDDGKPTSGKTAAAAVTVSAGGGEAADRPCNAHYNANARLHHHHHHHHQNHVQYQQPMSPPPPPQLQQQAPPDRTSSSQLQLHYMPSPLAAPPGSSSSSGAPSPLSRPGTARLSTAGVPMAFVAAGVPGSPSLPVSPAAAGSPAAAAWTSATQLGGGASASATAPSQWTHRRLHNPPAVDDDRPASKPHNAFSSSMLNAAASPNLSPRTSHPAATGPGAMAAAAAAAASVAAAAPPSPAGAGPAAGRSSARRSIGEVPVAMPPSRSTAPGAPLDGWSSRGAGLANGNVRRHVTVGNFFSNLLAAAGGQARSTGFASQPEAS